MKFSDRLRPGVYSIIKIPITYFIKITNNDWIKFHCQSGEKNGFSSEEGNLKFIFILSTL